MYIFVHLFWTIVWINLVLSLLAWIKNYFLPVNNGLLVFITIFFSFSNPIDWLLKWEASDKESNSDLFRLFLIVNCQWGTNKKMNLFFKIMSFDCRQVFAFWQSAITFLPEFEQLKDCTSFCLTVLINQTSVSGKVMENKLACWDSLTFPVI